VNSVTIRAQRTSKHLSDPFVRASLQIDAMRQVPLSADLRARWEQIIAKGIAHDSCPEKG